MTDPRAPTLKMMSGRIAPRKRDKKFAANTVSIPLSSVLSRWIVDAASATAHNFGNSALTYSLRLMEYLCVFGVRMSLYFSAHSSHSSCGTGVSCTSRTAAIAHMDTQRAYRELMCLVSLIIRGLLSFSLGMLLKYSPITYRV